jgi:hypothetical protein
VSEVLVSRLLARLDELERAARAVEPLGHNFDMGGNRQDEKFTHARIVYASEDGRARTEWGDEPERFGNWEPNEVLRLCRAHRDIIEQYQRAREAGENALMTAGEYAAAAALELVVETIAHGLGVEETTDE